MLEGKTDLRASKIFQKAKFEINQKGGIAAVGSGRNICR